MEINAKPVQAPAPYVPEQAISFGNADGTATLVSDMTPLPVAVRATPVTQPPLTGTLTASTQVGPFAPDPARPIWVQLAGTWSGTAQLLRTAPGTSARMPLTFADGSPRASWTRNVNAPVAEESVAGTTYWLDVALTGGALSYRVEQ